MRTPSNLPPRGQRSTRLRMPRRRIVIIIAIALVVVLIGSLRTLSIIFTDYLWFNSLHLHQVWSSLLEVKVGLFLAFAALFGAALFASLTIAERMAPKGPAADLEDEFVRRYRAVTRPYSRWIRLAIVVFLGLVMGSQAIAQWQNWILFRNGGSFGVKDALWHKDAGYYVFKLPFENFCVHWAFAALIVILVVTIAYHYLNGGIRTQGPRPRVRPAVKVHLSVILSLIALVKAAGYVLQRYSLVNSSDGYVNGAGYADVHARLPALELLILVSVASFVLFLVNIRLRGWAMPSIGVGMWFLVALTAGTIYPAAVQQFKVKPAQNSLEIPYIARNITATRAAFGISDVAQTAYPAVSSLTAADLNANSDTLANIRLWDPAVATTTFDKLQDIRPYFQFDTLALDRYDVNGVETPVVVGAREVNGANIPATSWVNEHLQYTHGYGMIVSPANQQTPDGNPVFSVSELPPVSQAGLPQITQPAVYYGVNDPNYVIANSKTPEIDYQLSSGANVETHYSGSGGVQLSNLFDQLMFGIRFGDYNLVISNQISHQSRLMFARSIQDRVHKAAPFLALDSDPYPVIIGGRIQWVQDAYTTTNAYPYSQPADTSGLNGAGDLSGMQFNYIRNSVKVVMDAYTGHLTFYVMDPKDPIIRAYERAFPGMFTQSSQMPSQLRRHLRYPENIFTVQATMYGRYHITNAAAFYSAGDAWTLSQTPGSGSPTSALQTTTQTTPTGQIVSTGQTAAMSPLYQELRIPGESQQSFNLLDAFVPAVSGNQSNAQVQTLSGFMIAGSDPSNYGRLSVFSTPRGAPVKGPALISAQIDATSAISTKISYLNQGGSEVQLGNLLMIPIANGLLYVEPMYVQSSRNSVPVLQYVIADYGDKAVLGTSLSDALTQVFQAPVTPGTQPTGPTTTTSLSPQVRAALNDAQDAYTQAQADLKAGNLGAYQSDVDRMESDLAQVQQLIGGKVSTATTTTTTTAPGG